MSLAELELISCSDCDVLYRPEISCLCHIDVILPVAADTDEAPAFECGLRFLATFILILSVHIRIERAGHLVRIVDVEVDTILTGLDRNIVSIILEVFHRATPVGAPGCVKTELELSSSSNVDIGIEYLLGIHLHDNIIVPVSVKTNYTYLVESVVHLKTEARLVEGEVIVTVGRILCNIVVRAVKKGYGSRLCSS